MPAVNSENFYRTLVENSHDLLYTIGVNGAILYASPSWRPLLGYEANEVVQRPLSNVLPPDDAIVATHALEQIITHQVDSLVYEQRLRHKQGELRWFSISLSPVRDTQDNITYIVGRGREITRDKTLAQQLQASADFFTSVIDALPDPLLVKDENHRVLSVNTAYCRLINRTAAEILSVRSDELGPKPALDVFWQSDPLALESAQAIETEETFTDREGAQHILMTKKVGHRLPNGKKILIGTCRDMTAHKRAEEQLRKAKEAAEAANQTKSAFLSTVTHELRTPLNGILGLANLLLDSELNAEQFDLVNTIHTSGHTLLTLINDILDFSKIEANKLELEPSNFDLRRCLEESLDLVAPQATAKGLTLTYLIEPGVPTQLCQDVTRLRQILVNLLGNAVKFTDRGEVTVLVSLHQQTAIHRELHFAVQDTGIGIPAAHFARLFQVFSQGDGAITRRFGGTGLGLAISKRLAELMGGAMWVESAVGRGSTFHFTLQACPTPQATAPLDEEWLTLSDKRILIIEENEALRRLLAQLLTTWAVAPCFSGPDAPQLLAQAGVCDALIMDGALTTCHSLELIAQLQQQYPQLPIVLLTYLGERLPDEQKRPHLVTVSKPLHASQLHDALVTVISDQPATTHKTGHSSLIDAHMAERHPLKILLAEDNMVNQKVVVGLLAKCGYRVDAVGNGLEVIEALERQPYDLILMDVNMPEMDGVAATQAIRNLLATTVQPYIVALTANAMQEDHERCRAAGMNDYLSKPIQAAELIAVLNRVQSHHLSTGNHRWGIISATLSFNAPTHLGDAVDPATLAEIADLMGEEGEMMVYDLVQLFLQNSPLLLEQMRNALNKEDASALFRAAHTLRSPAAQVGAYRLATLCQEVEMTSEATATRHDNNSIDAIYAEYEQVRHYFMTTPGPWGNAPRLCTK